MSKLLNQLYEFGEFQLDVAERLLRHGEKLVPLTPKAFETLLVLVRRAGHLVEKDDLMKQVWADAFVEEANLARNIWTLRKALGDDQGAHHYIETVPKLGYRFVAPAANHDEAARIFGDALAGSDCGCAGWVVAVDPLLQPAAHVESWAQTRAMLRDRAA